MGTVKGCLNRACSDFKSHRHYKKDDEYCTKCGERLYWVCKKCHCELPDNTQKHCIRCIEAKESRKEDAGEKLKSVGTKVGAAVLTVGSIGAAAAKFLIKK